jgi:glycosyltransferase involved in cell wall biosynthesis
MQDTGPRLFLSRMLAHADLPPGVEFCNPNIEAVRRVRRRRPRVLIARLDGTSYYRMTARNFVGLLHQRRPGLAPAVSWLGHAAWEIPGVTRKLNRRLDRGATWLLAHADAIVFQSELSRAMHTTFLGHLPGRLPETVIMNGVPTDEFTPGTASSRLPGSPAVLISASLYRLHKRLHSAIRLVNFLAQSHPGIQLHVLGAFDALVQRQLPREDTSRCVFHGRVPAAKLPDFYRGADLQLSPSLFDPCPNVVCEGLASGLPVFTPKQSGAAELVGAENAEWIVDEHLPLEYRELHVPQGIPELPVQEYAQRIEGVLARLAEHHTRARERAERALDIRAVAAKYRDFAVTCAAMRGAPGG